MNTKAMFKLSFISQYLGRCKYNLYADEKKILRKYLSNDDEKAEWEYQKKDIGACHYEHFVNNCLLV